MKVSLKNIAKKLGKLGLVIVSVLFLLCFTGMVFVQSFIVWLNTNSGGNWLSSQIEQTLAGQDYDIHINGLALSGLSTLHVRQLSISEQKHSILEARDVRLRARLFPIALKKLYFSLSASEVSLLNLPSSNTTEKENLDKTSEAFTIPDIPFQTILLSAFIDQLHISDTIIDEGLSLSIEATQLFETSENLLKGRGSIRLGQATVNDNHFLLPLELQNQLEFNQKTQTFAVPSLTLLRDSDNFLKLEFQGTPNKFAGSITGQAAYMGLPIALDGGLERNAQFFDLNGLVLSAQDTEIISNIGYNIETSMVNGLVDGHFTSFDLLSALADTVISGHGEFTLALSSKEEPMSASLETEIYDLAYDNITIPQIDFSAFLRDVQNITTLQTDLMLSRIQIDDINIGTTLITARPEEDSVQFEVSSRVESTLPVSINAKGTLKGTSQQPNIALNYQIKPDDPSIPVATIIGDTVYKGDTVETSFTAKGQNIESLNGSASFPLHLSLQPFKHDLDDQTPLNGKINGDFALSALSPYLLPGDYELDGRTKLHTAISGFLFQPQIMLDLSLKEGFVYDRINNIRLENMNAAATLKDQQLTISSLTAQDQSGQGQLSVKGDIDLSDPAAPQINSTLNATNMQVIASDEADIRLNADINMKTEKENYLLSGTLEPERIQITLPMQFNETIPSLNIEERKQTTQQTPDFMERLKMDLLFQADNQIFVRGWGLDAELGGELDVTGNLAAPLINGELKTIRGRYEELGKRFEIDHAILRFQGAIPPSPYLDVRTTTDVDDIAAHILITGRAIEPTLTFSSTPTRPEDEVLSLILFGKDPTEISPYQAIQLAQTLRRFSGKGSGGFDLMGAVRDVTGLDDIRVDGIGTENTTVGAGKYISDDVYIELEQGTGEGSGAASVEIEVTPNVKVESKTSETGDSDIGVFWEWDY